MCLAIDNFKDEAVRQLARDLCDYTGREQYYWWLLTHRENYKSEYIEYQQSKRHYKNIGASIWGVDEFGNALDSYWVPDPAYTKWNYDYTQLKHGDIIDVCRESRNPKQEHVVIHILEVPFKDVPLYMNSKENIVRYLVKYRLEHQL